MQRIHLVAAAIATISSAHAQLHGCANPQHNNGDTDGGNGYSNHQPDPSGFRRRLLDDADVSRGKLEEIKVTSVFASGAATTGVGANLRIREDNNGSPGPVIAEASGKTYSETQTGNMFFGRPEIESTLTFWPIFVETGTIWIEWNIIGSPFDNNFLLTRDTIHGQECWVNYEDLNGLEPGANQFMVPRDLNFILCGRTDLGVPYCTPNPNSTGETGYLFASGSLSTAANDLQLAAGRLPAGEFAYLLNSFNQGMVVNPGGSNGILCVGSGIGRHVMKVGQVPAWGVFSNDIDLTALPRPNGPIVVQPGSTIYFQCWHRDGNRSNFTEATCITLN